MSILIKEKLKKLFHEVIQIEKGIDGLRHKLFSLQTFAPSDLFLTVAKGKSELNLKDITEILSSEGPNEEILRRLIRLYSKENQFKIQYDGFLKLIRPKFKNLDKNSIHLENKIEIFKEILKKEYQGIEFIGSICQDIRNTKDFTTYEAFVSITDDEKYIVKGSIMQFINVNEVEAESVIQRFDRDNDGGISYEEFQDIFFPFQSHLGTKYVNNLQGECNYNDNDYDVVRTKDVEDIILDGNYDIDKTGGGVQNNENYGYCYDVNNGPNNDKDDESEGEEDIEGSDNEDYEKIYEEKYQREISERYQKIPLTYSISSNNQPIEKTSVSQINENTKKPFEIYPEMKTPIIQTSPSMPPKRSLRVLNHHLLAYLNDLLSILSSQEFLKESLVLQPDTSIPGLFSSIASSDVIIITDLISFLKTFGYFPPIDTISIFINHYSSNSKDLSLKDFSEIILPNKKEYRMLYTNREDNIVLYESKTILFDLVQSMIEGEKFLLVKRKKLHTTNEFSCIDSWSLLNNENREFIEKEDLKKYMELNGIFLMNFEADVLFRRFTKNDKIYYDDFAREILGMQD